MPQIFSIETKNVKKLEKFAKRSPRLFQRAYGMTLNNLAFAVKEQIPKAIDSEYVIRNMRFVESSIRVVKSKTYGDMARQEAVVGSIRRPRFSGWSEPVTGKTDPRDNMPTMDSRRSSVQNKITSRYRFKSQNKFRKQSEFKGKSKYKRSIVMVNTLARQKYRQPFLISGNKRIKPGLYIFRAGNRLRMIQSTHPNKKPVKRYNWADRSLDITSRKFNMQRAWEANINRVLPRKL